MFRQCGKAAFAPEKLRSIAHRTSRSGVVQSPFASLPQAASDELLFRLGLMSTPCTALAGTLAMHAASLARSSSCTRSLDTKMQHSAVDADCCSLGSTYVVMAGGVRYAEVVP